MGFISPAEFGAMRIRAVFIHTPRGPMIDPPLSRRRSAAQPLLGNALAESKALKA
jgi:hypothetical protein